MDRLAELLKFIAPGQTGIEIAPYFNPLVRKSEGWNVLVLDVFDTPRLRENARRDLATEASIAQIEDVDLVGPAHRMAELAEARGMAPGSIDFILSSHNFEHLPDPVRFLQAAMRLLRPGGVLSMAIPDCRVCFDAVRPPSTAGAMMEAFFEAHERPSAQQEYESYSAWAACRHADGSVENHFINAGEGAAPIFSRALPELLARWQARRDGSAIDYQDAHCWTLTPAVFTAILAELRAVGLCELELREVSATNGIEFYAHLIRPIDPAPPEEADRVVAYAAQFSEFRLGWAPRPPPRAPEIVTVQVQVPVEVPVVVPMGRKAMAKALILGTPLLGPAASAIWRLVKPR